MLCVCMGQQGLDKELHDQCPFSGRRRRALLAGSTVLSRAESGGGGGKLRIGSERALIGDGWAGGVEPGLARPPSKCMSGGSARGSGIGAGMEAELIFDGVLAWEGVEAGALPCEGVAAMFLPLLDFFMFLRFSSVVGSESEE